jgi:rhodanese-related sulfurtransferase
MTGAEGNMAFSLEDIEANARYFAAKLRAIRQFQDLVHKVKRDTPVSDFLLLDVRGRDAFAKAHVPSALCAPLPELERLSAQLPRNRELVTFCWSHH